MGPCCCRAAIYALLHNAQHPPRQRGGRTTTRRTVTSTRTSRRRRRNCQERERSVSFVVCLASWGRGRDAKDQRVKLQECWFNLAEEDKTSPPPKDQQQTSAFEKNLTTTTTKSPQIHPERVPTNSNTNQSTFASQPQTEQLSSTPRQQNKLYHHFWICQTTPGSLVKSFGTSTTIQKFRKRKWIGKC